MPTATRAAPSHLRVLAIGVFDLLHRGHLRYLRHARSRGDWLVVGVATDEIAWQSKARRPVVPQDERLELIASLRFVDEARLLPSSTSDTEQACQWMLEWRIGRVVVGGGWQGSERWQKLIPRLQQCGIDVEFVAESPEVSTTRRRSEIVARHLIDNPDVNPT